MPRRLKLLEELANERVNNARTRKLILRSVLAEERLQWWCVRYRAKLQTALAHAWGRRTVGILRGVLGKPAVARTAAESALLARVVDRWAPGRDLAAVQECVGFVLGVEDGLRLPLLVAYHQAKTDLSAGARLPYETLEGIRSTFHRDSGWTSADVLGLTAGQLTGSQRLRLHRRAEAVGVDVGLDLANAEYDATRLYLYAFARGLTAEVAAALQARAARTGARLPLGVRHAALVLDGSASMAGATSQPLRRRSRCGRWRSRSRCGMRSLRRASRSLSYGAVAGRTATGWSTRMGRRRWLADCSPRSRRHLTSLWW